MVLKPRRRIQEFTVDELAEFVAENLHSLTESEALAVLDNTYCSAKVCGAIARVERLTSFYTVRFRLVAHRQTPQAHAVKLVHYLYWPDLLRLSVDVQVPPTVRRAIDTQLLMRLRKVTPGEKIAAARRCTQAVIKELLRDPDPRVFEALLVNQRLREEDLVDLARSNDVRPEILRLLADDRRWSFRYGIRVALAGNPRTPHAVAAAQLRHLSKKDLQALYAAAETSTYVRRCIERLRPADFSVSTQLIDYNDHSDA